MLALFLCALQDVDAVRKAFEEGRDDDVLKLSEPLLQTQHAGDLRFLRGASMRRLGRPDDALNELAAAEEAGFKFAELHLERARAMAELQRWNEAKAALDAAEAAGPGDELRELIELERAKVEIALGENEPAQKRLEKIAEGGGRYGAPAAQLLEESEKRDSVFEIEAKPLFGFDSNILGLASDAALASERKRESFYLGGHALTRAWIARPHPWGAAAELDSTLKYFEADRGSSFFDGTLSLNGWGPIHDDIAIGAKASYGESLTWRDGHFRRILGGAVGTRVREAEGFDTDLWASIADLDFFVKTPGAQDRDAVTRQLGLNQSCELGEGWTLTPTAGLFDYDSDGSDFDHHGWQIGAAVKTPELEGFRVTVGAQYVSVRYENANSLSPSGAKRRDNLYTYTLTISRRFEDFDWTPSVTLTYNDSRSNVGVFDFDRFDVQVGVGLETWF